ncbi:MAG: hypothetical protein J7496_08685 [Novosphingobium sp.]|nr:hypothetical protein [Novosphingobium sp.]
MAESNDAVVELVRITMHVISATVGFAHEMARGGRLTADEIDELAHRLTLPPSDSADPTVRVVRASIERQTTAALATAHRVAKARESQQQ